MAKIKIEEPINLIIRKQFGQWPSDHLAQIYSGESKGSGEFCDYYYHLQANDRVFGSIYNKIRRGIVDIVAIHSENNHSNIKRTYSFKSFIAVIKKHFGEWLIASGLWEMIFRVRLSSSMATFVSEFKPDLIYCQGYSLGFVTLPMLIAKRFSIPICFQTTDDWPSYTYNSFPMGSILRHRTRQLVSRATLRMAFGEKMQRLYKRRYGESFDVTYHLDDPMRFLMSSGSKIEQEIIIKQHRIVYTGSLALRRYEALQDLLAAVKIMKNNSIEIQIDVYCSGIPKDLPIELLDASEIVFYPLPSHEEIPKVLSTASVLFLPESFNVAQKMIEYSISSKAHLYMMSGQPILVYGPEYSGTVEYAVRMGWGVVVSKRSVLLLKAALRELLDSEQRKCQIRLNAQECIQRYHNMKDGQDKFLKMLKSIEHIEEKSIVK
ncbi:glycosyltransferase family protein [Pelodictyon phaeoclathratiforme]|jgi:glycosyltransferase involved in cell wall biosynthesis|nr:glycosyltransferase family 4 protein [Pelodictyon phaeoclathratiforme]MBV5329857.1 hypothetical protein [Chlorobium sp.]